MDVIQVHNEPSSATCPHCGAEVALDQRYCLSCGQPCSPVRLAFLDVLQAEGAQRQPGTALTAPNGYVPPAFPLPEQGVARLTRYSGLFSLLAVLLLTGVVGLLIGHWVSGGGGSNKPTVYKIEGLGTSGGGTSSNEEATSGTEKEAGSTSKSTKATSKGKTKAAAPETLKGQEKEAEQTQKEKLPEANKASKATLEKLKGKSGKAYNEEIEKATESGAPLET